MNLWARAKAAYGAAFPEGARTKKADPEEVRPPGNFSMGTTNLTGPSFTDAFNSRRAPWPWQLIEKHKSLIYAMVSRNRNAVCRVPLRLYADGSRSQGKPRRNCDPIRVSRSIGSRLSRDGLVSPAAVDQVFEIRDHPLVSVLDKPDPYGYFDRLKLIGLMVSYCDVVGGCYLVPEGPGWRGLGGKKGPPDYLWALYAQYVLPVRHPNSPLVNFFQYFNERLPFEDVIWFKQDVSLRDPYGNGYSPTYAGDVYAAQEDRFVTMAEQVLGIGPRPSLIATSKDATLPVGEDMALRLEQDFRRRQTGAYAGGILVNRGSFDFEVPQYPNADPAGVVLSEYDRNNLACLFGQPPTFYVTDTNLANLQAADVQHARNGVEPRCKQIAATLTYIAKELDPRLFWAFDSALPDDEESKQKVVDMQLKAGQITINQANEEGKYPPVPWGDEPWLPATLVQPSMAIEQHKIGIKQGEAAIKQGDAVVESQEKRDDFELRDEPAEAERTMALAITRELQALRRKLAG